MTKANDTQVGGTHYKKGGEEHWDRVARLRLDYFQAQIMRYVERWKDKDGVQDLKKARHFLDKYIELAEAGYIHDWTPKFVPPGYGAIMAPEVSNLVEQFQTRTMPRHPYDARPGEGSETD